MDTTVIKDYTKVGDEARRLGRRHGRSYSLIQFRGDTVLRDGGSVADAIREMRAYCHCKTGKR